MSSTLLISEMAWLVSLLNTIFSFARSSRIQILFEPIGIRSISFVFEKVGASFPVRRVSASASEGAGKKFPGCSFYFHGVFRIDSHSCSAFPGSTLFPDARNVILVSRLLRLLLLLLLCLPITLQRDLGSVLRSYPIFAISWHCGTGDYK